MRRRKSRDERPDDERVLVDPAAAHDPRALATVGRLAQGKPAVHSREVVSMQRTVGNKAAGDLLVQRDKEQGGAAPKAAATRTLTLERIGAIPIDSFSFLKRPKSGRTEQPTNEEPAEITFSAPSGDWTPRVARASFDGLVIERAEFIFDGGRVEMENVVISNYQVVGEDARISFTVDAAKATITFAPDATAP